MTPSSPSSEADSHPFGSEEHPSGSKQHLSGSKAPAPALRRALSLDSRSLRLFFAAALVLLLTVASVPFFNFLVYSPARTVAAYLHAIESGEASRALGLLAAPETEVTAALDEQVLRNAPSLPSHVDILASEVEGDAATVSARFNLGNSSHQTDFSLVRAEPSFGLYDRWLIRVDEWPRITLDVTGSSAVEINGVSAPADRGAVPVLFPVGYDVGFNAEYLRSEVSRAEVPAPGTVAEVVLQPEPTEALQQEVQRQIDMHLDKCVTSTTLLPTGCTFGYETNHEILGDVSWRVISYPQVTLTSEGTRLTASTSETVLEISGRSRDIVTAYESDFTESLAVRLSASVHIADGTVTVKPQEAGQILGG